VRWYDSWTLSVFDEMYRMKRMKTIEDGAEGYLLEKYSNRIISRPKSSLTIEDDGASNLALIFHKTDKPHTYKIEDKATGKYLESVFGTTRWQVASEAVTQEWVFWLEEDGYFRIENADDGVCLSVSGNTTEAGTTIYMATASKNVHQSFAPYFDSTAHPDYEEADMWSRDYLLANREEMQRQQEAVGVKNLFDEYVEHPTLRYDMSGRQIQGNRPRGLFIISGKKIIIK
jgi:hypothetical protein